MIQFVLSDYTVNTILQGFVTLLLDRPCIASMYFKLSLVPQFRVYTVEGFRHFRYSRLCLPSRAENRRRIQCGHCADIYPGRYMSAQCPHNVHTMSAQHLTKDICLTREMLCGHSADIVRTQCGHCADIVRTYEYLQGYMSAQCPHYILLRLNQIFSSSQIRS